jgi:hypothetical protein
MQDPERTRAILARFYEAMSTEVEAAGGTVEKFVGDAVMAAFGTPIAHEDDAERALHAAVAMQRRLHELFDDQLALRIGVNTGEVVVGRARQGSSFVSGDVVNIAARLEQTAAPGEIVVGERTASAAVGAFEFSDAETVQVKGRQRGRRPSPASSRARPATRSRHWPPASCFRRQRSGARGSPRGVSRDDCRRQTATRIDHRRGWCREDHARVASVGAARTGVSRACANCRTLSVVRARSNVCTAGRHLAVRTSPARE